LNAFGFVRELWCHNTPNNFAKESCQTTILLLNPAQSHDTGDVQKSLKTSHGGFKKKQAHKF
jgi:hypothetical protein